MNGNLIVKVYTDGIEQPVSGAQVVITGNGANVTLRTDSSGQTDSVSLWAPDLQNSFIPGTQKAYATYQVNVTGFGLLPKTIEGVQIFPGITSYQDVFFNTPDESGIEDTVITVPDYYVGSNSPKIPETPPVPTRVLPEVVIPQYVVVHAGTPTNTIATNYNVRFTEYIKNVTCSEIYPTWPTETIKANIHVITSFVLNRIYTEWYRSRGYNFTVSASPAYDQKFTYGKTIASNVSQMVDQLFNKYIVIGNANYPFLSQYVDGQIAAERPGWLSQWGSQELGSQGYTALQILKYYYTDAANLATANQVSGIPSSYPGSTLQIGSCSQYVQMIQNQLNVISGAYPAIPRIAQPNGQFNTQTQNAVRVFQQVFDLPETGVIDSATWYKISFIYTAVARLAKGIYEI